MIKPVDSRLSACFLDFIEAGFVKNLSMVTPKFLKAHFRIVASPPMRKDGVRWRLSLKGAELKRLSVDEPHDRR
jgi:hypothetical protein